MSRRNNAESRCQRCRMHASLCVCALLPTLHTRTRLLLIIHRYEDRKPTNTGRLATLCLPNSEVVVRGHQGDPSGELVVPAGTQPLLLFPSPDAIALTELLPLREKVTLVVPDGTWRQASKVRKRVPGLQGIPCVSLPQDQPSTYRLRAEAHEEGLATVEAIARALGLIEGESIRRELERVFRVMVERTLWARGSIDAQEVELGIPEGARRHDPESGVRLGGSATVRP